MLKLKIFIVSGLFLALSVLSNTDSTKSNKYFIDINTGSGQFIFGKPINSSAKNLTGDFHFHSPVVAGFSFGYNFSKKESLKRNSNSFLSVGGGLNFMTYRINHFFENYDLNSPTANKHYEFSQNQCSYNV